MFPDALFSLRGREGPNPSQKPLQENSVLALGFRDCSLSWRTREVWRPVLSDQQVLCHSCFSLPKSTSRGPCASRAPSTRTPVPF